MVRYSGFTFLSSDGVTHRRDRSIKGPAAEAQKGVDEAAQLWVVRELRPKPKGGLVFKAHRLLYHSTLGLRVIKRREGRKSES